jgi:predicted acetyltransferase
VAQAKLAADDFEFVFQAPDEPWAAYVDRVEKQSRGVDVPPEQVPATFLLAEVDGEIVGRVSIRHELNDYLEQLGDHIGYAVRPAYRGRGYATAILGESLRIARALGLARVLLMCDDANTASLRTIESCGGVLERVDASGDAAPTRRYWIDLTEPIR